jgi:formamidopyrimidine-DNA glycosylase
MPELPEVETYRRYIQAAAFNQTIDTMTCEDPRKLLLNDEAEMLDILRGAKFVGSKRVGKHLFIQLSKGKWWLYMHFGMTGDVQYFHEDDEPPRHARIVFYFTNGFRLGFICPRKFERVGITDNPMAFLAKKKVAEDALDIPFSTFFKNVHKRKMPIKSVLLDQSTVAGIGNWIADDVLHRAKIHPERLAADLTEKEVKAMLKATQHVVNQTIAIEANYEHLPDDFLIHARGWGKIGVEPKCPICRTDIVTMRVGGRATYFCPKCQVIPTE